MVCARMWLILACYLALVRARDRSVLKKKIFYVLLFLYCQDWKSDFDLMRKLFFIMTSMHCFEYIMKKEKGKVFCYNYLDEIMICYRKSKKDEMGYDPVIEVETTVSINIPSL